jgi:hypothetical protein
MPEFIVFAQADSTNKPAIQINGAGIGKPFALNLSHITAIDGVQSFSSFANRHVSLKKLTS